MAAGVTSMDSFLAQSFGQFKSQAMNLRARKRSVLATICLSTYRLYKHALVSN